MGTSPYIHDPSHESHVTSHESHGEREKKRKRIMDIEWFVTDLYEVIADRSHFLEPMKDIRVFPWFPSRFCQTL